MARASRRARPAGTTRESSRLGQPLFRFGVVADSHLEPEPAAATPESSVVPRSNRRSRHVVEALNRLELPFVVHLGDIVHPVPVMATYGAAADLSRKLLGGLRCPMYMTPGNHDIGDKSTFWSPAAAVRESWIDLYRSYFGDQFSAFDHGGCHFVLINSPILNSGLPSERRQRAWLEADLRRHRGRRLFFFTHYPPFLVDPAEPSHYDNIDEPARSWLLGLVHGYRVEALFTGHVHNFFYNRLGQTDVYILPSTSFVRRDYSELFRVEAAAEFGRNDTGKVGYFVVTVHERGHVARFHRTGGRTAIDERSNSDDILVASHPKLAWAPSLGVHLRHPWAEIVEMPYNGPVDEFIRKRARNDYTVEAFWDLGLRHLRVPLSDLEDRRIRQRMRTLAEMGHRFTVFSAGVPGRAEARLLTAHARWLAGWELVLQAADIRAALPMLRAVRVAGLPTSVARLHSSSGSAATEAAGANFKHFVSHGFAATDGPEIRGLLAGPGVRKAVDGLVFRVGLESDPWDTVTAVRDGCRDLGVGAIATVCLSPETPSGDFCDDAAVAVRVAQAGIVACAMSDVRVFLDTFVDVDRGYCVRHGLLDRRYNRRLAGHVLRNLNGLLASLGPNVAFTRTRSAEGWDVYVGSDGAVLVALLLKQPGVDVAPLARLPLQSDRAVAERARLIDLATGGVSEPRVRCPATVDSTAFDVTPPLACATPAVLLVPLQPGP